MTGWFVANWKVVLELCPFVRVTVTFFVPAGCGPTATWNELAVTFWGVGLWLPKPTVIPGSKLVPVTVTVVVSDASTGSGWMSAIVGVTRLMSLF